jgi:hypothetical protein
MIRSNHRVSIVLTMLFAASAAPAATYCSGTASEYYIDASGKLVIFSTWRSDWTALCSTQGTWNGIAAETCLSWAAMVNSAKVHNKTLSVYYSGDFNCSTLATYENSPAPFYVRLGQ